MRPEPQALSRSSLIPRKDRYGWAWIVSAVLHGVILVGFIVGASLGSCGDGIDSNQKPIVAKLVRLGTPREERLLPRLPTAPPAQQAPKDAAVVTPGQTAPVKPDPTPAPPAPTETAKPVAVAEAAPPKAPAAQQAEAPKVPDSKQKMDDIMKRFASGTRAGKPEELPGQADGDPMGDAERAEEGERYLALVEQRIKSHYIVPSTIPDAERVRLVAVVTIRVERNGTISSFKISEPSGNGSFDAALESAVKKASPLPPPPDHLLSMLKGLAVRFRM
ncbi:TonB family protein [Vulgatibacter incomptus]|uniref:Putative TolA protein n=1 Tax=Vulgatibacter incomptus TaxID=1391653 RepID=A0A0K1PA08_9BACT|nr:TonB family protein [Vulgatibacter incomptus]AKU90337.1 Putative TolA protein [Vulgatibacter incomptus]